MILLIDNYDSFTHNLVHLIGGLGRDIEVVRNDSLTASSAIEKKPKAIVISPGPCTPNEAGICLDLVNACATSKIPLFGVCLGMQAIAQTFGAKIVRADRLMHGKTCGVSHAGDGLFRGLPSPFTATRYHSLVADRESLPDCLIETAQADDDNEIMAIAHENLPISGVQFHPESIASEHGAALLKNFLDEAH